MYSKNIPHLRWALGAIMLLTLWFSLSLPLAANAEEFKFVVWGDSQLHHPEVFKEIVEETECLQPAFVVQVGDLIHGYTYDPANARRQWKQFKQQIAPLSVPYYPLPGNHDVTTAEIEPIYGQVWGEDKYYYSFDYGSAHFILLDTYLHQKFDTIPAEEMEWLEKDLEKHKDADHIFVAFHSPLYLDDEYDWETVEQLFSQYPVRAVFTGHSHIYDYRRENDIDYFCLNSSGRLVRYNHLLGQSHHFMVVTVKDDDIRYAVVTRERMYPPDAVPPGMYTRASKYLKEEQTIIIPDPAKGAVEQTVEIPVTNNTKNSRTFELVWETDNYVWDFEPWGARVNVAPGKTETLRFNIACHRKHFTRGELPALRVDSPFTNAKGYSTTLTYYHRLFYPPETTAIPLKGSITLDGKMTEDAWNEVPSIKQLHIDTEGTPAPEQTVVKVLYNSDNLYVGIQGEEPNPEGLAAFAHGEVPLVFGDDDFELYFDTNRDLSSYYRLMVNPKGTVLCSGPDGLFSFTFDVQTHVGEESWSAEFRIPYEDIDTEQPEKGDVWGFNVRRHRQQATHPQRDWSKMRNFPYQPQYFGLLQFQ